MERLPQTLLVTRVAVFLAAEAGHGEGEGSPRDGGLSWPRRTALTNLGRRICDRSMCASWTSTATSANDHIFLENPQQVLRLPNAQQRSAGLLDLNYYLPCRVANREGGGTRTVAIIGLGRTDDGRLPFQRGHRAAGIAGGVYRHRDPECAALYQRLEQKITRVRAAERVQREHCRVDPCRHLRGRSGRPHRELERADGSDVCEAAREALRQSLAAIFPAEFMEIRQRAEEQGVHTLLQVPAGAADGRDAGGQYRDCAAGDARFAVVGRIILVDDITDRIELESQLTQAEKLSSIGLLAAGVAHEVNTPLAVISSYTQMLAKQMRRRTDARLAPVLEKITQQTFRASEIVNGLLNFSRTGGAEFARVDLNQRHQRYADAAGAPVQDRADQGGDGVGCRPAARSRQSRASCSRWS